MKTLKSERGAVSLVVVAVVAIMSVFGTWFMTSKRTDTQSKQAKAQMEATAAANEAQRKIGATAAASATQIGVAAGMAPESPANNFIKREITSVLGMLPAPDPVALLEAERRRVAVMEGQLKEADRLYGIQSKQVVELQANVQEARAAQDAANLAAAESAAVALAAKQQRFIFIVVAILFAAAFVWRWINSVSPNALAEMRVDMLNGVKPVAAMDSALNRLLQKKISKLAKQKVPLPDEPQA